MTHVSDTQAAGLQHSPLVSLEDELDAMAQRAAELRRSRLDLHSEVVPSSVALAQRLLHSIMGNDLVAEGETVEIEIGTRAYGIHPMHWGAFGRHSAMVISVQYEDKPCPLWDPRQPHALWDGECPPRPTCYSYYPNPGAGVTRFDLTLASAAQLAQFGLDARPMMQELLRRETDATQQMRDGSAAADTMLGLLDPGRTGTVTSSAGE